MRAVLALLIGATLAVAAPAAAAGSPFDTSFDGDGKVTTDFGATDVADDVAVQPDGKIVAAGHEGRQLRRVRRRALQHGRQPRHELQRRRQGRVSGGFATGSEAYAVALQPDGKIVVAGYVGSIAWSTREFHLQRYNTDGSLDTSFSGDGTVGVGVGTSRRGHRATASPFSPTERSSPPGKAAT